jgi:hypothetical protein
MLISMAEFEPSLKHLNMTQESHWHVWLIENRHGMHLHLPLAQRREDMSLRMIADPAAAVTPV